MAKIPGTHTSIPIFEYHNFCNIPGGSLNGGRSVQAVLDRLGGFPPKVRKTLTLDNGTGNASHQEITQAIGLKCFFAHPYASWERGSNEQVNGLIRYYLPKGTDFGKITEAQISAI